MTLSQIETEQAMRELAKEIPVDAVRKLEEILKRSFGESNVPYTVDTLRACICILEVTTPALPMMYAQMSQATLLILYRLIEELETGLVSSPIKL